MITSIGSDKKIRTYKTDGKDDSTEINFALSHAGTITLEPATTYSISDSLIFQSNTTIDCLGATLKLAPDLPVWGGRNVSIAQEKALLMAVPGCKNITLKNVVIDGSQSDYYPGVKLGTSCYNMLTMIGVDGLTIENCTFKNGCNDAILLNKCSNILINKINVNKCGHDGIYAYNVKDIAVKNCKFINRTNSSCRFDTVTGGEFVNNDCTTSGGGFAGLELENTVKNLDIYGNYFHEMPWSIAKVHANLINVKIYGNRKYKVTNGMV